VFVLYDNQKATRPGSSRVNRPRRPLDDSDELPLSIALGFFEGDSLGNVVGTNVGKTVGKSVGPAEDEAVG